MPDTPEGATQARATPLPASPGQTVGPFFHHALPFDHDRELVPPGRPDAVRLHGYVLDGNGDGVPDALLEIRQADPSGRVPTREGSLRRPGGPFTGWGRASTDPAGHWWFATLEPGPTRDGAAAFVAVTVFARGLLNRLFTRIYLPGDGDPSQAAALERDALLSGLDADRRAGLVAAREADGALRFDVRLQGERETVFLAFPRHDR